MNYIDAEKLIAEIEKSKNELKSLMSKLYYAANYKEWEAELNGYNKTLSIIASPQQEMELPDKYQTPDWIWEDKTVEQFAEEYVEGVKKCNDAPTWDLIHTAVCYGYELGRYAGKEENK